MNKIVLRFSLLSGMVVAGVAMLLLIQRHARVEWRERRELLRQQDVRFTELSAENKRLSNLVAQTRSASLTIDQFMELLKLRGEVGQWRQNASEVIRLQAANRQLLAAIRSSEAQSGPALPDPKIVLAYWSKSQLASVGYADPASALQTALLAMSQNDPNALAASVTPETRTTLASSRFSGSNPAEQIATGTKWVADSLAPSRGFYVVGQKLKSQDQAILDVYFDGEGATRGFALKRIDDEWKVDGIYLTGENDDEPRGGARLWP